MAESGMIKKSRSVVRWIYLMMFSFLILGSAISIAEAADSAQFTSQSVAGTMARGRNYSVSVTMLNNGTTTWTKTGNYRLGSQNPGDNSTWGLSRVLLSDADSILPGQTKTFIFTVTSPTQYGNYNFQWRVLKEGVAWFGDYSTNVSVKITDIPDRSANIAASGTKPLTPGPILDDFNYAAPINKWGAPTGTFSKSAVIPTPANESCGATYINDAGTDNGRTAGNCLKLAYNVSQTSSTADGKPTYVGYYSNLGLASLSSPTVYTAVSFWVKGGAGGELFKIQLSNTSTATYTDGTKTYKRNLAAVYIPDYLDGGVTTSWRRVTIPFHNFANLDGFSSMKELVLVFENSQSAANGSVTQGTVYIDDIRFETTNQPIVRVAHLGEVVAIETPPAPAQPRKKGVCALGGNMGTAPNDATITYTLSSDNLEYADYTYGLRLEYDVRVQYSWAAAFIIFGGGNDTTPATESGWIAVPHNFSAYNYLVVRVRGSGVYGNPGEMKIELQDSGGTRAVVIYGINTTALQTWHIPLVWTQANPGFQNLDKTSIKQLTLVIENDGSGGGGSVAASKQGRVFIDSIQFEQ